MLLTTYKTDEVSIKRGYQFVIYKDWQFHFFSSNSQKAYKRVIKKLGFTFSDREEQHDLCTCKWLNGEIVECSFTKKQQLPRGAKSIKALSNGSIVKCYYKREGDNLLFFRPNPNCKDIYKPLSIKKHIKHTLRYGVM